MSEKKTFFNATLILTSIVCLLPMILGFALWKKLPDQIPQQYGWNNQVNWTLPKFWGIITLPLVMVAINIIYSYFIRFSKQEMSPKVEKILAWIIPLIALPVNCFMLLKPIGFDIEPFTFIVAVLSIFFIIVGNYLPKTKPNAVMGVRAPWINKNPVVWNKTQRVSGILMVITGLINLVTCFFAFGKLVFVVTISILIIFTLFYSIIIAKKESKKESQENSTSNN
jgi:uncharacterized membrane protein